MEVKIKIPSSLDDLTLSQYMAYLNVESKLEGEQLAMEMVHIFCNLPMEFVHKLELNSLESICADLTALFDTEPQHIARFKFKGLEWGFIPSLETMTIGEYIDLENTIHQPARLHEAMAVLYRPIRAKLGHRYEIEEYEGYSKYNLREMPLSVCLGAYVFFYRLGSDLLQSMTRSLEEGIKEDSRLETTFKLGGVGIAQFMDLLRETYSSLTELPKQTYTKPYYSSRLKKKKAS